MTIVPQPVKLILPGGQVDSRPEFSLAGQIELSGVRDSVIHDT